MENKFKKQGYQIIEKVYSEKEINRICSILENKEFEKKFGVREFLKNNPELIEAIFTKRLIEIINSIAPKAIPIKSLYFDKPPNANWVVTWHQDLTINLQSKKENIGYKNWRVLKGRTVVQPPTEMLENIFTIRIHLDDCTKENGALKVVEGSHQLGVISIKDWVSNKKGNEQFCEVQKGGILLMKPLTLHSSKRVENDKNRRVIHIEFCDKELPKDLEWNEAFEIKK